MRGHFFSAIAMVTLVPSILQARSDDIPTLDVRPVCRGIASQSADPGVGQSGQAILFDDAWKVSKLLWHSKTGMAYFFGRG